MKDRFLVIDSLRGLAIAGIFLYHSVLKFNFPSTYVEEVPFLFNLDKVIEKSTYFLLFGKMFGIFSFFFGFTFQLQNAKRPGIEKVRIVWRMILLMLFGFFNSLFIPMGDILVLYSLIGIMITPVFFLRTNILLVIATILLLQPFEIYRLLVSIVNPDVAFSPAYFTSLEKEIRQTLASGDFWQIAKVNFLKGIPASLLWDFHSGRITQVTGLFILGMIAAREGFFQASEFAKKFWLKASLSIGLSIVLVWLLKQFLAGAANASQSANNLGAVLSLWINTLSTIFIISIFTFLYYINRGRIFHPLSYLGKMSLTNYIAQSVIGALIFSSYGLNLANNIGITYSVLLTIALLFVQIFISRKWLQKHQKGPLEAFWFYLTWIDKKRS